MTLRARDARRESGGGASALMTAIFAWRERVPLRRKGQPYGDVPWAAFVTADRAKPGFSGWTYWSMRHWRVPASLSSEHVGLYPTWLHGVMPMISNYQATVHQNKSQSYRIGLRNQ